jgi:shikimate dehydrogenase
MSDLDRVSARTRLFCLLGDPVSHSKSPPMMNAAFAAAGIDAVYLALRVEGRALGTVLAALRDVGAGGANVTAPHKQTVIPFLDDTARSAERTGSVNTIVFDGGRLIGHSTDGEGLVGAVEEGLGTAVRGKTVCILGAGGAARGVLASLIERKADRIVIANRSAEKAEALARDFDVSGVVTSVPLSGPGIAEAVAKADILVNATALPVTSGTFLGIDLSRLKRGALLFDMNYGKKPPAAPFTPPPGIRYSDGLPMLLHQGAASFALWTGQKPPIAVMRKALAL